MKTHIYGFRIVGPCTGERRLIDAAAGFRGYADCSGTAGTHREGYLSAFDFDDAFADFLRSNSSPKGYVGSCWSPWLWFDIDRSNLDDARIDTGKLATLLCERYAMDDSNLLIFFSGNKGFHIGLPTSLFDAATPSMRFNRIVRRVAERLASVAGVAIDSGVYDQVRPFRAPNSRHPKSGLHKRQVPLKAIFELSALAIAEIAKSPEQFEIPDDAVCRADWNPSADWNEAAAADDAELRAIADRRATSDVQSAGLNRFTRQFIRDGAAQGDRHRLLYSAARNLGEFDCPLLLAIALLTEPALDSGLTPSDVRRQIECGINNVERGGKK